MMKSSFLLSVLVGAWMLGASGGLVDATSSVVSSTPIVTPSSAAASSSSSAPRQVYITNTGVRQVTNERLTRNFILMNGGSEFFDPVQVGWENTCREYGTNCRYFKAPAENCSVWVTDLLQEFVAQNDTIDGIAMAPCDIDIITPLLWFVTQEANIPIVLFDNDIPQNVSGRSAYIGTDNLFLGRTMANVLKQLRPEGGTFGILSGSNKTNLDERIQGFREEISRNNDQEDKAKWDELDKSPMYDIGREILKAQDMMDLNPTAIMVMYQTPMRSDNWTDLIEINRDRNVTIVGSDSSDYQIEYLNRRYVDGLVGQLPYDMGRVSLEVLHELATTGTLKQDKYGTSLVSYTLIPLVLPEVKLDENLLGNLVYVGYCCFGIVVVSVLASASWTTYYREELVVRAAQPFFLLMVAGGVLLLSSTLVPLSFDDGGKPEEMSQVGSVGICMSIPWLAFTGFTVTFSALFSKTWRVNRLFRAKVQHARIQVTEKDVLAPFAILFTSNIVVLICWTKLDPLTYTREESDGLDFWNRVISTYGVCRSEHPIPYLTVLAVINFSVVAIACWQAFQARDIKSEFSESKYIGSAMSSLFQGFLTGIPILVIVKDTPKAFYIVLTLTIFLLCMAVLLLIFLPKVVLQREYSTMTEAEQKRVMAEGIKQSQPKSSYMTPELSPPVFDSSAQDPSVLQDKKTTYGSAVKEQVASTTTTIKKSVPNPPPDPEDENGSTQDMTPPSFVSKPMENDNVEISMTSMLSVGPSQGDDTNMSTLTPSSPVSSRRSVPESAATVVDA
jgi:ABC-type sugar transport system substrate-binding protein